MMPAMEKKTGRRRAAFRFKPFSRKQKQLLFWYKAKANADKSMIIADGSIRSGKTIAMICSFLMFSMNTFENTDFIVAGKTISALKRNVVNPMLRIIAAFGWSYRYNRGGNYITVGTNTFYLFGASSEAAQDVLQGMTAGGAFADEAALMPKSFIEQMIGRCSLEDARIFMNCNPGSPFHWLKAEMIDKADEKGYYVLHFKMDDNLSLSDKVKRRYMQQFDGVFYERYILGKWVMAEGLIYSMFGKVCEYSEHLTEEKRLLCQRYIAVDYGTANACVFLDIYDDGRTAWLEKEYYYDGHKEMQKTDGQYADDMDEFVSAWKVMPKAIIIDPSALSFRVELRNRGYRIIEADNDVINGIRKTSNMLKKGMLRVHEDCTNTIAEFGTYSWDEKAGEKGIEQPIKVADHSMDALRYFVSTAIKDKRVARGIGGE